MKRLSQISFQTGDAGTRQRTLITYVRIVVTHALGYAALGLVALVSLLPLVWMVSTSLKAFGREFLFPPQWFPNPVVFANYLTAFETSNLGRYFGNTLMIAVLATMGTVISSSLVAFGFARLEFFGKRVLFVILLSTLMLPGIVTLVPTFVLFKTLGWIDTPLPLIVPWWFGGGAFGGAFFVFLIRQFMLQLPRELDEAALVDGASYFRIYWRIMLPLSKPALAASAIFSFIHHWNDFLNPLIFLNSEEWRTIALYLRFFLYTETGGGAGLTRWNLMMAASVVMLIPVLVIFFSAQRYFIRGVALTGIAGR